MVNPICSSSLPLPLLSYCIFSIGFVWFVNCSTAPGFVRVNLLLVDMWKYCGQVDGVWWHSFWVSGEMISDHNSCTLRLAAWPPWSDRSCSCYYYHNYFFYYYYYYYYYYCYYSNYRAPHCLSGFLFIVQLGGCLKMISAGKSDFC